MSDAAMQLIEKIMMVCFTCTQNYIMGAGVRCDCVCKDYVTVWYILGKRFAFDCIISSLLYFLVSFSLSVDEQMYNLSF